MGPLKSSPLDGRNPWGADGRKITIEELRAEAPYIPLPSSDLANDGNLGTVWVLDHASDSTVPENHVSAALYYPASGIELTWSHSCCLDYTDAGGSLMIDGVEGQLFGVAKGPTGSNPPDSILQLPVGLDHMLRFEGPVAGSDLVDVAHTLSPSPSDASPGGDLPPANLQPGPYITYWDTPLSYGVSVDSVDAAAPSLAFQPVAPPSLGDPSVIFESDPSREPASDRALSLRYDDPSMGRFWLLERPSLATTTALLSTIPDGCTPEAGCKDTASMIDLGGGVSGLRVAAWGSERIVWVENGVYYEVTGPVSMYSARNFTPADALSVAKAVVAGAAG
jgi:hypothetical protein